MWYGVLADLVVVVHLVFIIFVLLGGLFVLKWKYFSMVHMPAVMWAACIEFQGWICPLTPLENWFRGKAGGVGYQDSFISHYLVPILYPIGLTRGWQIALGAFALCLNIAIYFWVWRVRTRTDR